jgi:hypothetical protein
VEALELVGAVLLAGVGDDDGIKPFAWYSRKRIRTPAQRCIEAFSLD